jgi:dGTPase
MINDFKILSVHNVDTKRISNIEEHKFRSPFQRDRDRIIHSKAFRRLAGKTQIFNSRFRDHLKTRLTHVIEVSQIATTIAKALNLNTELTEAIALAHDLGHTPFGHSVERTLNNIMNGEIKIKHASEKLMINFKGFKHNWQSVRVVTDLEKLSLNEKGLNLTLNTLWGILYHSKLSFDKDLPLEFYETNYTYIKSKENGNFEAAIVHVADEIAQRHHDIEDGLRLNIVSINDIMNFLEKSKDKYHIENLENSIKKLKNIKNKNYFIPFFSKTIIDIMASDVINNSSQNLNKFINYYCINSHNDFLEIKTKEDLNYFDYICFSQKINDFDNELKNLLKNRILNSHLAQTMDGKSNYIVKKLFEAYITNSQQLPDSTILTFAKNIKKYIEFSENKMNHNFINEILEITGCETDEYLYEENHNVGKIRNIIEKYKNKFKEYEYSILFRTIADYISGMTDNWATEQFRILYGIIDL